MFSTKKTNNNLNSKNKKTKKQTGAGLFKIHPKKYTDIVYKKSGYKTATLTCLQCKHNVFRRHNATHESKLRDLMLEADFFSKKYNIFICYQCGFMMNYSGDISYSSDQS
jgi:predicted nucleic-acid-binding Zn-ribbon protein